MDTRYEIFGPDFSHFAGNASNEPYLLRYTSSKKYIYTRGLFLSLEIVVILLKTNRSERITFFPFRFVFAQSLKLVGYFSDRMRQMRVEQSIDYFTYLLTS